MYPKNAASPEPIAIGAVVQISDGAVQTSGCTVRVKPIGVAEGDGGGTTAYSTDGIVLYTPTQAETNYTSFILIAKKTGCIPVSVTVVTTASSVPGRTMPADGSITAAAIANGAIDAATFAADVDAEILSYLVDDATRIDASALNTATGTSIPAIVTNTGTTLVEQIEDVQATADAILIDTGTTLQAEVDGIQATLGSAGAGLTSIPNSAGVTTLLSRLQEQIALTPGGAVTVATVLTDAIDAAAIAASAVTEIQNGLATAANLATVAGYLDTEIMAILEDTGTTIPAQIAALNNLSSANVLTQVNAALDTAIAELSAGVPSATPTTRTALMLLYMALRNRTTTTATAQTIQNDAGTTIATATLSDDGTTMTKAEFA